MSSCFTVDVSCTEADFVGGGVYLKPNLSRRVFRHNLAIIAGSGAYQNSTMHTGVGNVNYVSYFVRRIQFESNLYYRYIPNDPRSPAYAVLFKVPYREPLVDLSFDDISDFILFKEVDKVLGYSLVGIPTRSDPSFGIKSGFKIDVKRPFIVGPNDYVGVYYFIPAGISDSFVTFRIQGTATVWFDPV